MWNDVVAKCRAPSLGISLSSMTYNQYGGSSQAGSSRQQAIGQRPAPGTSTVDLNGSASLGAVGGATGGTRTSRPVVRQICLIQGHDDGM